jgi:hypothetical protein
MTGPEKSKGLKAKVSPKVPLMDFRCFERASELPSAWDACMAQWRLGTPGGGAIYLEKAFLEFLEAVNPCGQRYWFSEDAGVLFVTYELKLNLLNFARFGRLAVPATVIGVPLSVAAPGFATREPEGRLIMARWIRRHLKGLTVILNVPEGEGFELPEGLTLSSYVLSLKFNDFEAYVAALRSPYRRQVKRALEAFDGVETIGLGLVTGTGLGLVSDPNFNSVPVTNFNSVTDPNLNPVPELNSVNQSESKSRQAFEPDLYPLYVDVFNHSKDQLEKLEPIYFEQFPGRTFKFTHNSRPLAFVQTLDEPTPAGILRHFVLGGFDRSQLQKFDLYRNLLLQLIQEALADGCTAINLGQTAAESKSKTGALEQLKYLYVAHSNPALHKLLGTLVKRFSYQRYRTKHHVFK